MPALAIRDALAEDGDLEVRIGITTGEALIALDSRPETGEGMASGDVVNTAARLQAAAPIGAILVDETTFRATERAIELEEASPVEAKGKSSPVRVWKAVRARAHVGVERTGGAKLVGRERELTLLRETFSRVLDERSPQLVTLVGVPGIGKSRLVFELFETLQTGAFGLVYWRHGRSLPYGDGITFWALGEIVKAQAGILESDGSDQAGEKLTQAVERFVPAAADAAWVERHLRPLVGLEAADGAGDRREEAFTAWRRFLEAIADDRPLVLVFEDLHWADEALLDFVDHLVDWASGVRLLVLCTARPELLARRTSWGGGKVNSSTILVSPLSEAETAMLVHELLDRSVLEADLQARLLEHAGGNPLYAEEFTRMLLERPADAVLPESVQGMIAARLDTLAAEEKELLQDAAVIGRTFWLGALGGERRTLGDRLHSLERKEFVSRQRRSSVAGEAEYAFHHALVRDVAYEQIPRIERAGKHRATAEWIESLGRPEDNAEMLAHHYAACLRYARASGQDDEAIAERARIAFREAGDRAFSLNAFPVAGALLRAGDRSLAAGGSRLAGAAVRARPSPPRQRRRAAGTVTRGSTRRGARSGPGRAGGRGRCAAGRGLVVPEGPRALRQFSRLQRLKDRGTPRLAGKDPRASQISRYRMLADKNEDAIRIGEEALSMAERLGLDELRAHALDNIGTARTNLGDATRGWWISSGASSWPSPCARPRRHARSTISRRYRRASAISSARASPSPRRSESERSSERP